MISAACSAALWAAPRRSARGCPLACPIQSVAAGHQYGRPRDGSIPRVAGLQQQPPATVGRWLVVCLAPVFVAGVAVGEVIAEHSRIQLQARLTSA
jgi:hypothetical protein